MWEPVHADIASIAFCVSPYSLAPSRHTWLSHVTANHLGNAIAGIGAWIIPPLTGHVAKVEATLLVVEHVEGSTK